MEGDSKKISELAERLMKLAHDDILIHLRFFDTALARLAYRQMPQTGCMATDGSACFYDPVFV